MKKEIDEKGHKFAKIIQTLQKVGKSAQKWPKWVIKSIFERFPDSQLYNGLKK
jgi:hypothetical protein